VLLTEGAPDFPGPDRLWATVERHSVTTLGVSPTLIRALIPSGSEPVRAHDLSSLRILASTGEPWNPEPYRWLMEEVGEGRLPIINLSGGTEVGACFLSPLPITELRSCTLRGPALGMDVDVWGPDGTPLPRGEVGELVCKQPWPAMTRGVWGDDERYLETYWRRFPGVWVHGDWASVDEDGFWFLHGRSDDAINVAGRKVGPAEVEGALMDHDAVNQAAAVGVPDDTTGQAVVAYVILESDVEESDDLRSELREQVGAELGKPFRPREVLFVDEFPKTQSGKIIRRAIEAAYTGEDLGDMSSIENPDSLDKLEEAN